MDSALSVRLVCLLVALPAWLLFASAPRFHTACVVDYRDPVPVDWLTRAGIQYVYIYSSIPIEQVDGKPAIDPKTKPLFDACFKEYAGTGIKVLPLSNYYSRSPKATWSVDSCGREIHMGCFTRDAFHGWMGSAITDMAKAFGQYEAFGGFCFDDAPGNRVDCCYCNDCRIAFKAKFGVEPPKFEHREGAGRIDPADPVLLWDAYHRGTLERYNHTQCQSVREWSEDLLAVTITADSYFFGRHLNIDAAYEDTRADHGARLQRIDRSMVRWWHLFQSFGFPRVPEAGEAGYQRWAAGCHITTPSPKIIVHREGPMFEQFGRSMFLSPAEIKRLIRTTIAEGAPGIAFWASSKVLPHYPEGFEAMAEVMAEVQAIEDVILRKRPFPARVGLVYSTTTEICEQPWKKNTLERWQHLHAFEATAYSFLRSSVQHQIVFDSDLTAERIADFDVLVLPGVRFLTHPVASALEAAAEGADLTLLADRATLQLEGATVVDHDPQSWWRRQRRGYRQPRHLDEVRERVERLLVPKMDASSSVPVSMRSERAFGRVFVEPDGALLAFIVNWDLDHDANAVLTVAPEARVHDVLKGMSLGGGPTCEVSVPAAGWRVVRVRP